MKEFWREKREAELREQLRNGLPRVPIRLADQHDEQGVLEMCEMMHAEQPLHELDMAKVAAHVRLAIQPGPERRGILGVIGDRHDLKGGIFLLIEEIWYSRDWHLQEYFNFVKPQYRRMGFAQDLIAYGKHCSDQIGIDLTVGVFSTIRTEAKIRLYRRWLPCVGAIFCYPPPNRKSIYERLAHLTPARAAAE